MDATLALVDCGSNGLEELCSVIDESATHWAVCRLEFGASQTTRRTKRFLLRLVGEACPAAVRGRSAACSAEVRSTLGAAGLDFDRCFEVAVTKHETAQSILRQLTPLLSSELGVGFSYPIDRMLREYEERVCERSMSAPSVDPNASGEEALISVSQGGSVKWVLFGPDASKLPVKAIGNGPAEEMLHFLAAHREDVFFGLLRISVECNGKLVTRFALIQFCGEGASVIQRSKICAVREHMKRKVGEYVSCSFALELTQASELSTESFTEKIQDELARDVLASDECTMPFNSLDSIRKALKTDFRRKRTSCARRSASFSVEDAVREAFASSGTLDWALLRSTHTLRKSFSSSRSTSSTRSPGSSSGSSVSLSCATTPHRSEHLLNRKESSHQHSIVPRNLAQAFFDSESAGDHVQNCQKSMRTLAKTGGA